MSGTGSRQNTYPSGPVFFLPLNHTAHKPFKQFKNLFFRNDYFLVKFTEVKSIKFQQAEENFWRRTAGTFYTANRIEVLFPRRKYRYFWKIFGMFSSNNFSVLPVKAGNSWTCRTQGWFCKLDTFFFPALPPGEVNQANFYSVPENAFNASHTYTQLLLTKSYLSRLLLIKIKLQICPMKGLFNHPAGQLPEFSYL